MNVSVASIQTQIQEFLSLLEKQPVSITAILAGLVLLILFIVLTSRRSPKAIDAIKTSEGKVVVSHRALKEITSRLISTTDGVGKTAVKFRRRRGKLCIKIAIDLASQSKLSDVSSSIQRNVIQGLKHHLALEKLGTVNIIVKGFIGNKKAKTKPETIDQQADPEDDQPTEGTEEVKPVAG